MKIVFLHMTMGLVDRGSEVSTDLLATSLSKKNEVLVIQSGPVSKKSYKVKQVYPLQTAPTPAPKSIIDKIHSRLYLDEASLEAKQFTIASLPAIKTFDPDIIVATNGLPQLYVLKGEVPRAKIVIFGRSGIGYHDRDNLSTSPDLFISLSKQAETWARTKVNSKTKVVYIPNPVSPTRAKKINVKLPKPVVICVGALTKYKNIDRVIEAIKITNASLLLVGDGEESDATQKALSTLPNDFRWIRHLGPSEMADYYASADAFCFVPDSQESFGRVYLEAMAAGLPIVASDDTIRHDLIKEQGIFVDPQNISDIAMGINAAVQLDKINYSVQLKEYELNTVVSRVEKEFHDLIS
jgi:glycosyltransferase involved in cell wall biosynthesis